MIKQACGCTYEKQSERWGELCPKHEVEYQAIHQRAAREKAAGQDEDYRALPERVL